MSVLVVCPTRDRPDQAVELAHNVLGTSNATICFYVDEDQGGLYGDLEKLRGPRVIVDGGKRQGVVNAANGMACGHPNFGIYGLMCDDMRFGTAGWDEYLESCFASFYGRIGVVSPAHDMGTHVDVPFVSREWIDTLGWFALPFARHYCWPTVIAMLGECTNITHADERNLFIVHHQLGTTTGDDFDRDGAAFYKFMMYDFYGHAAKLRKAIGAKGIAHEQSPVLS